MQENKLLPSTSLSFSFFVKYTLFLLASVFNTLFAHWHGGINGGTSPMLADSLPSALV